MEASRLAREEAVRLKGELWELRKVEELKKAAEVKARTIEDELVSLRAQVERERAELAGKLEASEQKGYDYCYEKLTTDYQKQVQEIS